MPTTLLTEPTRGRGMIDITSQVQAAVTASGVVDGLCTVFIQHTSASVLIQENADPTVRTDFETWMSRVVPDGDPDFVHDAEGPDDMPAHIRAALTAVSLGIPVVDGRLALGTWQGVYVYEHRTRPHSRRVLVTTIAG
ncbi:MAG: secondary thiamine-phosphate synthase enzyme YjbQ [bacterium]|nr:secondary thiamine-phosphate synthase enzyme YjbQ [Planctomycetaceae bacterium]